MLTCSTEFIEYYNNNNNEKKLISYANSMLSWKAIALSKISLFLLVSLSIAE